MILPPVERSAGADKRRPRRKTDLRLGSGWLRLRFRRFVANEPDLAKQIGNLHAAESFEERRNLSGDFGDVAGELVGAGGVAIAGGDDGDLVDFTERFAECADDVRETGEEFVDDGSLVVLLEGLGLDVHCGLQHRPS